MKIDVATSKDVKRKRPLRKLNCRMESEVDSLFSMGESTACSSYNPTEVSHLQNEILKQSQQIEKFIQADEEHEGDSSFVVLKSLFALFKSELSVNLTLRRLLVEEKKSTETMSQQIEEFFAEMQSLGFENINDFGEVIKLIQKQATKVRKFRKLAKHFEAAVEQNSELTSAVDTMRVEEADKAMQIASLTARLDQSTRSNKEMTQKIEESNLEREKIEQSLDQLTNEMKALQARINEMEQEKTFMTSKFTGKKDKMKQKMADASEKVKLLQEQIENLKVIHEQEVAEVKNKYKTKMNDLLQQRKEFQSESQKTIEQMKATLEAAMSGLREDKKRETEELKTEHVTELEDVKERYEEKLEKLTEQFQAEIGKLNSDLEAAALKHKIEIDTLKQQHKQETEALTQQRLLEIAELEKQKESEITTRLAEIDQENKEKESEMITQINRLMNKLNKASAAKAGAAKKISKADDSLSKSKAKIEEQQKIIAEMAETIEGQEKRIQELTEAANQAVMDRAGESDAERMNQHKFKKLLKKIQVLKEELDRITEIHTSEVERIQKEADKREEEIRASIEESYSTVIAKYKLIEKELGFQVNEQQIENKRLRDQLRQYSYILERKEYTIAKLQLADEEVPVREKVQKPKHSKRKSL